MKHKLWRQCLSELGVGEVQPNWFLEQNQSMKQKHMLDFITLQLLLSEQ